VVQELFGADFRIDPEVLRQVTQLAEQPFLILQDVETVEMDISFRIIYS
jgi:hypothetical protein